MQSVDDKLREYAEEMGLTGGSLTLDQLISGHRAIRAERLKSEGERRLELQLAREHVVAMATKEVKELGWFSVERLRGMTLAELAELIRKD